MAKKTKDESPPPAWLVEDSKRSRRAPKPKKQLKARPVASKNIAEPELVEPDQLISSGKVSAPPVDAPSVTINPDRGSLRKQWGRYKSESMATAIIAFHRAGIPEESIQAMVGISPTQYHNWISADPEFARMVLASRATWEYGAIQRIMEIADAKYDWKCYAWLLEKANPNRWGPNATPASTVDAPSEGAVPVNLDPVHTAKRLEELVMKAKAAIVAAGEDPEAVGPIAIDTSSNEQ